MRKKLTAIVLAVLVFSLIAASAASLGGINTADLGADSNVVASCDSDGVDVSYTFSYSTVDLEYVVTGVDVTAIDAACDGEPISVTLASASASETQTGTVTAPTATVSGFSFSAEEVTNIAIVIG